MMDLKFLTTGGLLIVWLFASTESYNGHSNARTVFSNQIAGKGRKTARMMFSGIVEVSGLDRFSLHTFLIVQSKHSLIFTDKPSFISGNRLD